MKIAFILSTFPALSETFILNQLTGLIDLGHNVDIYSQSSATEEKMHSDVKKYGLLSRTIYFDSIPPGKIHRVLKAVLLVVKNFHKAPVLLIKSLNFFKYGRKALSLRILFAVIMLLNKEYDIIQCHYGPNGSFGSILKEIGIKGKLVTMFHGWDIRHGIAKKGRIYEHLFKHGDCFLAISDYNYQNLLRLSADPKRIIFHPVGIDLKKFKCQPRIHCHDNNKPITILTVARLAPEKGLDLGLRAIHKVLSKFHPGMIEYRIVGDGPLKQHLEQSIQKLQLNTIVRLLGGMDQDEVIAEMKEASIFLLPSLNEALPMVLIEAQAMELPVVATSVGSTSEAMLANKSGFLVQKGDANALAEGLIYLVGNQKLWPEMGKAGRQFIESNYDIAKLNIKLESIYKNLLN
jgi:colanic acid/amylovoran biosynthesis glycosyltransferase